MVGVGVIKFIKKLSMVATTIGEGMTYNSSNFFEVLFILSSVFLFGIVTIGFWYLWRKMHIEQKTQIDLLILILSPFCSLISVAVVWWNLPSKGSSGYPWLVFLCFLIIMVFFTSSLYLMIKGRYRFLSAFGSFVSGLASLPICALATAIILGMLMK